ncbi:LLM class flavin-dependent oxidoreductase [Spongiactinospora sp. TRM90649]|uniref:LLM class flavin-dependent oxidoreductase n=1 Tax=Spongiactinospora sp. TRM90649 TaxID=3031114 RepID=UPI0023FA151C|nr:LLM class flavin-dependent oxidoreductase [Spongiactinospora sp. TRM90649]MDF5754728.1 LLM class flavin-dependent oxidoreductase [Spongiactinospora sp. TRM90649]
MSDVLDLVHRWAAAAPGPARTMTTEREATAMRVSVNVTNYSWPDGPRRIAPELARLATEADQAGIDTLWVSDHLIQADPTAAPGQTEMLEAYTTLGFLAAGTERVNLGTMVTGVTFRPPTLLVKAVTTLDVLTGGRAWLGVGTGYHADEADDMGLPMPPLPERYELLEETLRLARQMWAGDESPFEGVHARARRPVGSPRPLAATGRPKVLIGSMGERRTLPLVARYGDACNLFDVPDGGRMLRHKLDVLARHCEEAGRPYDEIEKTLSTRLNPGESGAEFARRGADAAALGIDHLVVITPGPWTPERLSALADAVTRLR